MRGLASTAAFGLVKASRRSFVISGGSGLPLHFCKAGFGVEEIELAGAAFHEHEDDVLGLGREVRLAGARAGSTVASAAARPSRFHQLRQGGDADAAGALLEEAAAGLNSAELFAVHVSFPRDEFVQVEQHAAQLHPRRRLQLRHAFDAVRKQRCHRFRLLFEPVQRLVEILAHALALRARPARGRA